MKPRSQCAPCRDPTLRRPRPLPLSPRLQARARPARHKGAVPEDPAGAGWMAGKVSPKEEDAELLLCSRGADRTGTLTVPEPGSDFITFGRESRLVDFSAVWWSGDGAAVLALLPKELFRRNPKTEKAVK